VTIKRISHPKEENEDRRTTRESSAFDHFMRGFRRNGGPLLTIVGRIAHDEDGRTAQFSVEVEGDVLKAVSFNVTTCATLIAYCEFVAEGVTGATLSQAASLTPQQVIAPLKGVPPHKHDCARLAVSALHAAVETALDGGQK
jgi:NifU-like protein involved in Fe-S cluster formation